MDGNLQGQFAEVQREIDGFFRKTEKLTAEIVRQRQHICGTAALHFVQLASGVAPVSTQPHKRYSTPKASNKMRAPRGSGRVVATYFPGNLAISIRVLKFRQAKSKVYVGAKLQRGNSTGNFGVGNRADGYYMHIVEQHSPFFAPAWQRSRGRVYESIVAQLRRLGNEFEHKNKI